MFIKSLKIHLLIKFIDNIKINQNFEKNKII